MTPTPPIGLGTVVTQYFPIVIAIVGTIAVALGGLSKFKEKRQADLMEATTTWRGLAESRHAALEEERERTKIIARLLVESRERERSLWVYIRQLQGDAGVPVKRVQAPTEYHGEIDLPPSLPSLPPDIEGLL